MASRQQEKSEQTRNELKTSAYKLFLEKGYDGTTIAEITSNAGYATGSFYRHWKEKEEIFNLLQDEFIQNIKHVINQAIEKINSFEGIVSLLIHIFYELTSNRATLRFFVESPQAIKNNQLLPKMSDLLKYCTDSLAQKIKTLSEGKRSELSAHQIANLIYSFLSGYILLSSVDIEVPPIETLQSALLTILKED